MHQYYPLKYPAILFKQFIASSYWILTRSFFFFFLFLSSTSLFSQLNVGCDNWLNTPSLISKVTVGDLDVVGNKVTVEAIFNMSGPTNLGVPHGGKLVSKHTHETNVNYALIPNGCEITTDVSGYKLLLVCPVLRNKTYHVALVYDGASLKFYRNGFLMAQTPCTGNLINNDLLTTIAQVAGTDNIASNQFPGVVNEVRIWNVARTQAQIRAFMNTTLPTSNEPGLLGYYIFNDLTNKQGDPAFDGVIEGGAIVNQPNPNCFFIADSCATPAPCSQWLNTPSLGAKMMVGDLDITGNQLTVEAMFNRTQPLNSGLYYGNLVSKHTDQTNVNYSLLPNGCEITTTGSGYQAIFQDCPLNLNETYHVAMVYDGSMLKYYRDGFLMSQVPCTGNLVGNNLLTTIGQAAGGGDLGNNQFLGYINEVRIWNVARSQADLRAHMGSVLPAPATQTGLAAYYSFNNIQNKQGNTAWNGTLFSTALANQTNPNCDFIPDSCQLPAQDQVINYYTEVLSLDACKNNLTVSNANDFNVGDTVLLIQMKGAVIDSTNTASFGDITDYGNAGNYEFNYVKSKTANVLELLNVVIREYDYAEGKVQLVRVPYFQDYTVTSKLTAMAWDGSKGGVLAFNVQNTLTLNQNIDVSEKGFKGGAAIRNVNYNCNIDSFYVQNNDGINGGRKGEGIYSTARLSGRGKLANGGGGGNSTNSGGGGGGNGGNGGAGGKQYVGTVCNNDFPNGGVGGLKLNYSNAANKIFLGGGGGSGQEDDSQVSPGGDGGGIAIISAGTIIPNTFAILAEGQTPEHISGTNDDGRSAGGAGGTVLLNYNSITGSLPVSVKGGHGDNCIAQPLMGLHGPGGGGSGGIVWVNKPSIENNLLVYLDGGINGINLNIGNNPWGAEPGQRGDSLKNLVLPVAMAPFKTNIDSVRIDTTRISCYSFDFEGLGYVNTFPVDSWEWHFGDGGISSAQNASHTYNSSGIFPVKLIIADVNGCKDSITTDVGIMAFNFDFNYDQDVCNPLTVQFNGFGTPAGNDIYWDFGDGSTIMGINNPIHTYSATGNYIVRYSTGNSVCSDTVTKTISIDIIRENIILTQDTTICAGTVKQLLTVPSIDFCWTPSVYLDNPNAPQPVTSTPDNITYYFTAKVIGSSLILNGDFSQGNAGFTSEYNFMNNNQAEGQYFVGINPQAWNGGMSPCGDHTTGNGNMMIVNGSPTAGMTAWEQIVTVTPNTNYAFSTWIQTIGLPNPAQLEFSINGQNVGNLIAANLSVCTWDQFYTTWNSGSNTTATISIVNRDTQLSGNDFALDDISFAPVFIKRDSVIITVEKPLVTTNEDTTICAGESVQLNTNGAQTYVWTPASGLSNTSISNPVATPEVSAEYIVTGTTANGCEAKDTVHINIFTKPAISTSGDGTICKNTPVQLLANGGIVYSWSPGATLNDPDIGDPVATPVENTVYYVLVTDANTCTYLDSVELLVHPDPVFAVNMPGDLCTNDTLQLSASGGNIYSWQPAAGLSNAGIADPMASPPVSTDYTVTITETACNQSADLMVRVNVLPLPDVRATSSNDLDCSTDRSQLSAAGADRYTWMPAATLSSPFVRNPIAMPITTTKYLVAGTDAAGCTNYDSIIVNVENTNKGGYLMPNAFTPNADGSNDCYGIKYWGIIYEVEFSIFNRWGERIFFTKDPGKCWDGTYKGVPQDPNVFVYMIKAKTNCEPAVFRKGTFALIR